jgi:hypothetical protein
MENQTSFDLSDAIQRWRQNLAQSAAFHSADLDELEGHLRDAISALQASGLSSEESFLIASRRIGTRHTLESEFGKINARHAGLTATATGWSLRARLAYRFAASYFAIFWLPAVLFRPLDALVAGWMGVSRAFMNPAFSGSGDRTVDWVHALTVLTLSVVATVVWSVMDRKRREYTTALAWTRLALRYLLAWVVMAYGLGKVFPMQFQPPPDWILGQPLGDFSRMGLLWAFMGASMGYTIFAGAMQTLGALLLLFRRTTLAGALITAAVMTNVFALNIFYDVPVKLYSFHYGVMALVIAAPDLGRLFRFALLQKPADPPSPAGPVFAKRHWMILGWVGKGLVLALLSVQAGSAYTQYAARVAQPPHPLTGVYRAVGFPGWQQVVVVENVAFMTVKRDNGQISTYRLVLNDGQSRLQLGDANGPAGSLTFRIFPGWGSGNVTLEGNLHGEPARMHLVRSRKNFLLLRRGFHWINERSFN